jgi:UDP-N-acetyl-D-mannosaminuronic acid transferase (WecB/TagA/CpsF family)
MATLQLSDARSDGVVIGQSTTDLVAFYGGTPAAQRANASQAAVSTTNSTTTTPAGYATTTQANAIVTLVNEMRAVLVAANLMKGSA